MREPPLRDDELRVLRGLLDEHRYRYGRKADAMSLAAVLSHTLIVCMLIVAYVALVLTGNNGEPLLAAVPAYLAGAGVQRVARGDGSDG